MQDVDKCLGNAGLAIRTSRVVARPCLQDTEKQGAAAAAADSEAAMVLNSRWVTRLEWIPKRTMILRKAPLGTVPAFKKHIIICPAEHFEKGFLSTPKWLSTNFRR
jgi:hypothetical protein